MLESLLLAYFFHHVTLPASYREPDVSAVQNMLPRGRLRVTAESVAGLSIPPGAQRIEVLRLHLRADCTNDVPLYAITVRRRGLGAASDIDAVYAVMGGKRISIARPISRRDGITELTIRKHVIPACGSEDISILADFSPSASIAGEHRFEVYLEDFDAGGATVLLDSAVTTVPARRTSGRSIGRISVTYLTLHRDVRFGSARTLARFRFATDGDDDHAVTAITLTNFGSASRDDLRNLFLENSRGDPLTNVAPSLDGDSVRLVFDPILILEKNAARELRLRGDVHAGSSRTIQFRIEEPGDIESSATRLRSKNPRA